MRPDWRRGRNSARTSMSCRSRRKTRPRSIWISKKKNTCRNRREYNFSTVLVNSKTHRLSKVTYICIFYTDIKPSIINSKAFSFKVSTNRRLKRDRIYWNSMLCFLRNTVKAQGITSLPAALLTKKFRCLSSRKRWYNADSRMYICLTGAIGHCISCTDVVRRISFSLSTKELRLKTQLV